MPSPKTDRTQAYRPLTNMIPVSLEQHRINLLVYAASLCDCATVAALLSLQVPIDGCNKSGQTALTQTVRLKKPDMREFLLEAGADPVAPDGEKQTALMHAVISHQYELASRFVSMGGVEQEDSMGFTALVYVIRCHTTLRKQDEHHSLFNELLHTPGSIPNEVSFVHQAAANPGAFLQHIMESGVLDENSFKKANDYGETAYDIAAQYKRTENMRLLKYTF